MIPIQTILHPTDFSKPSEYALRFACALATTGHGCSSCTWWSRRSTTASWG